MIAAGGRAEYEPPTGSGGESGEGAEGGERITRLFPKCRPRGRRANKPAYNAHRMASNGDAPVAAVRCADRLNEMECRQNDINNLNNLSSDDEQDSDSKPVVILNAKGGGTYKLRDSRIIEIAGGRELYSQNRSKALRKTRHSTNSHNKYNNLRNKSRPVKENGDYTDGVSMENGGSHLDSNVDMLPCNITVTHKQTYEERPLRRLVEHNNCTLPRPRHETPPLEPDPEPKQRGSPIAVVADGEVVVFDDISDDWKVILNSVSLGLRMDLETSDNDLDVGINQTVENVKNGRMESTSNSNALGGMLHDCDSSESTHSRELGEGEGVVSEGAWPSGDEEREVRGEILETRMPRVIGSLPIADYEGSPRRYGLGLGQTPQPPQPREPRPGFPKRVIVESPISTAPPHGSAAFDYLYEFSETRKVLEEFFRCPTAGQGQGPTAQVDDLSNFQDLEYELRRQQQQWGTSGGEVEAAADTWNNTHQVDLEGGGVEGWNGTSRGKVDGEVRAQAEGWNGPRRVGSAQRRHEPLLDLPHNNQAYNNFFGLQETDPYETEVNLVDLSVASESSSGARNGACEMSGLGGPEGGTSRGGSPGPELGTHTHTHQSTDCDSNCGDLDSDGSLPPMDNELDENNLRGPTILPILEDVLSSSHHSDTDNNNANISPSDLIVDPASLMEDVTALEREHNLHILADVDIHTLDPLVLCEITPPPPAPAPHRPHLETRLHHDTGEPPPTPPLSPSPHLTQEQMWMSRKRAASAESTESVDHKHISGDEEEADTDLETDRLLGQQRTDDQGFFDHKGWRKPRSRTVMPCGAGAGVAAAEGTPARAPPASPPPADVTSPALAALTSLTSLISPGAHGLVDEGSCNKKTTEKDGKKKGKNKEGYEQLSTSNPTMLHSPAVLIEGVLFRARYLGSTQLVCEGQPTKATRMLQAEEAVSRIKECTDYSQVQATNRRMLQLLSPYSGVYAGAGVGGEGAIAAPPVLHPVPTAGTVFRLTFLGSVEVDEDGGGRRRKKRLKKNMVEEAVTKIKAPEGESQPSTEVDLFISTEKIMVLNTELKEIMMDHALRTISYIADIGDLVVLMARRRFVPHETDSDPPKLNRTPKMICHVFESEEAQFIAQSIGQAFQVAYMEFLKANGIEDHSFVKEMDYQEVLNSQEIFGDELQMFAKKELQKEVVVPKAKGEILGVVVVESGWGSMLPTVVIANLAPAGAAARCGQLNIGDQIIAINGVSLVGLPLSTCQTYIKNSKTQSVVKLTVVPCPPVVEVKIKRPDTKYQLGFSVQNGVICSLLRGGIAERGGVRVGHRIIEINSQSVVAVPHERIVNLLATSVGEILMKTMPTSMFRLLTGQENPIYI